MTDEERNQPASHGEPAPGQGDEAERLRDEWTLPPEEWDRALDRHRAKEEQRAQEVFGDRERFPIPDADTDT